MWRIQTLSEAEIATFGWRELAVKHAEWAKRERFWEKAVVERIERNKKLARPRFKDLDDRRDMRCCALANVRKLESEIERRENTERNHEFVAGLRMHAAKRSG